MYNYYMMIRRRDISYSATHRLDNVSPAICTVPIKSLMTSISWRPQPTMRTQTTCMQLCHLDV